MGLNKRGNTSLWEKWKASKTGNTFIGKPSAVWLEFNIGSHRACIELLICECLSPSWAKKDPSYLVLGNELILDKYFRHCPVQCALCLTEKHALHCTTIILNIFIHSIDIISLNIILNISVQNCLQCTALHCKLFCVTLPASSIIPSSMDGEGFALHPLNMRTKKHMEKFLLH